MNRKRKRQARIDKPWCVAVFLGHRVFIRTQKGPQGKNARQRLLGPGGPEVRWITIKSAKQDLTSLGVPLCPLVIVHMLETKQVKHNKKKV